MADQGLSAYKSSRPLDTGTNKLAGQISNQTANPSNPTPNVDRFGALLNTPGQMFGNNPYAQMIKQRIDALVAQNGPIPGVNAPVPNQPNQPQQGQPPQQNGQGGQQQGGGGGSPQGGQQQPGPPGMTPPGMANPGTPPMPNGMQPGGPPPSIGNMGGAPPPNGNMGGAPPNGNQQLPNNGPPQPQGPPPQMQAGGAVGLGAFR